jgi:hypothetical protein
MVVARHIFGLLLAGLVSLSGCDDAADPPAMGGTIGESTSGGAPDPSTAETGDPDPAGSTSGEDGSTGEVADSTGEDPTTGPDVEPGDHGYFDLLAARADAQYSASWRTLESIQADTVKWGEGPSTPTYDEVIDAARNEMAGGSLDGKDQLVPEFERINDGDVLFYWETRWDGAFPEQSEAFGIENHKTFVLRQDGNDGEKRMLEIRNRYGLADAPDISTVDFRGYGGGWEFDGESAPLDGQIATFIVAPDTWTRYWVYCDFESRLVEVWIADETRAPAKLLSKTFGDMTVGVSAVKFQFNSSQTRTGGEAVSVWNRNFVMLRNLGDPADAVVGLLPQ